MADDIAAGGDHIGSDADLYALGLLDDAERLTVEQHAAGCRTCLERLGEAEEAAAWLAAALPRVDPSEALGRRLAASARPQPSASWRPYAGAAAALFLLASFAQNVRLSGQLDEQQAAFATVVHSHFNHASLVVRPGAAPLAAKVLYGKDGAWLYLIVDRPPPGLEAFADDAAGEHLLGTPLQRGEIATLFVAHAGRPARIVLRAGPVAEAAARLVY